MSGQGPAAAAGPSSEAPPVPSVGGVVARNAAWSVGARFVFLFGWAVVTPYLLARLGAERFALWALFFALSGYFATFDLGLSQTLVRFVAGFSVRGDTAGLRGLVTLAVALYSGLATVAVVAVVLLHPALLAFVHTPAPLAQEAARALVGMTAVLGAANVAGVLTAVLQGRQRMDLSQGIQLLVTAFQIGASVLVLRLGGGLGALVAVSGASTLTLALLSLAAVRRVVPDLRMDPRAVTRDLWRVLVRFSAALQVVNLGGLVHTQLDKLLLARWIGLLPVTHFELGLRLASAAWAVPFLVFPALVPAFAELHASHRHDAFRELHDRAARAIAALSMPIAGLLAVGAPALVAVWLGAGHREVARATTGIGVFLLVMVQTGVATAALRGMGRPWLEASYHLVGMTLHAALSLVLVRRFGLDGALIALVVSGAVSALVLLVVFLRATGFTTGGVLAAYVRPTLFTAIAAALALAWCGAPGAASALGRAAALVVLARLALVFAAVVGVGYVTTGVVRASELRSLRAALRPAGAPNAPR